MQSNQPLISVVLATYNERPAHVKTAIDSILNQTYQNIELLIIDDSINAETKIAIDSYSLDNRVVIIRSETRLGFVSALNKGLERSRGEYIARMDGDDVSFPDRFAKQVSYLVNNPKVALAGGHIDIIDEEGHIISHREYPLKGLKLRLYTCFRSPLAHSTVMMRREVVDQGFRYDETLEASEDLDMWLKLMNNGFMIENVDETLLKFRVYPNFIEKRTAMKERGNTAKVRRMNFSWNNPILSCISVFAGWMHSHILGEVVGFIYGIENHRRSRQK